MSIQQIPESQAVARTSPNRAGATGGGAAVLDENSSGTISGGSRWTRIRRTMLTTPVLLRFALILLFGLYVRSVAFAPVYDDNIISPWISGWRDVPNFFTHDIFGSAAGAGSVYYRPLGMTWGFLVSRLTGGAPGWMHLSAIFLTAFGMILAYLFGRRLFRDDRLALLTAVLFGLHPSKVESTAWIGSSCVDGLGGVFFFASLLMLLKWCDDERPRWIAASVFLFTCAMFTKETMVFIPILIAVYLWLTMRKPIAQKLRKIAVVLLPYGVVWGIYMSIRHVIIRPATPDAEYIRPSYSLANLWTAPYAIWWYIRHLVVPHRLAVEYSIVVLNGPTLRGFVLPAIGVVLLFIAGYVLWRRQRSPIAAFLIFWFALTLAPQVILAPMVSQHDRYLYIPCYAFCALIAWAILNLGSAPAKARFLLALTIVALWSGLTWHEMGYWDCETVLWSRVLEISPTYSKAEIQLAGIYAQDSDVPKALSILDTGLHQNPKLASVWLARAGILNGDKQFDEARASYLKVMELTQPAPGHRVRRGSPARMRAGAAFELARLDLAAKNYAEAENYARTALAIDDNGTGYHALLGVILSGEGRKEEAQAENSTEMRLIMTHLSH